MNDHEISQVEKLAMMLGGGLPSPTASNTTYHVTARIPASDYAWLKAMTDRADVTRSSMLNYLLKAGIEAVLAEVPDEVGLELEARHDDFLDSEGVDQ